MRSYTFQIVINEGNDEFWEGLGAKAGVDELREQVEEALSATGWFDGEVRCVSYTDS